MREHDSTHWHVVLFGSCKLIGYLTRSQPLNCICKSCRSDDLSPGTLTTPSDRHLDFFLLFSYIHSQRGHARNVPSFREVQPSFDDHISSELDLHCASLYAQHKILMVSAITLGRGLDKRKSIWNLPSCHARMKSSTAPHSSSPLNEGSD